MSISLIKNAAYQVGELCQLLNHKWEFYPVQRSVDEAVYKSYNLVSGHNETLFNQMLSNVSKEDVVFDIGAKTGNYTLPFAALGCNVVGIEANPEMYRCLRTNINVNGFDNVSAYNKGVGDELGGSVQIS